MKRIIIYIVLTIIILGGLSFWLRSAFGFFTPYNTWTARQDIKNNKVQIIAVGLPYMPQVRQELAKKYGFEFYFIGCSPPDEGSNGIDYYNHVMETYLRDKFGDNFWTDFNKQFDSLSEAKYVEIKIQRVLDLVGEQKAVKDQIYLIDSLSKGQRHISLVPFLEDTIKNIYLVKVGEDNGMNLVTYFNYLVDANGMKIINPDGKLEGQ